MSRQGKTRLNTYENVRKFWEHEAQDLGDTPVATIRDVCFRNLEIQFLRAILPPRQSMLDIGCGNGHGTVYLHQYGSTTLGIDYTHQLIQVANRYRIEKRLQDRLTRVFHHLPKLDFSLLGEVRFQEADVLDLKLRGKYDLLVGQRILINLVNRDNQMKALENMRRVCRLGTRLYLTEATVEGHEYTDHVRTTIGLGMLEKYWHNCYVAEAQFRKWPGVGWKVIDRVHFDVYFLMSKVVYPAAVGEANCTFQSPANRAALLLSGQFRTWSAAQEVGIKSLLARFAALTELLAPGGKEGAKIASWAKANASKLPTWRDFGHQKLIVAQAV